MFEVGYEVYDTVGDRFGSAVALDGAYVRVEFEDGERQWLHEDDLMHRDTAEYMDDLDEGCYDEIGHEVEVGY